jgi:hypothetical protein
MTLDRLPPYPSVGCYVLKLHRLSDPARGEICGLLEHLPTGQQVSFDSMHALVEVLLDQAAAHLSRSNPTAGNSNETT